MYDVKVLIRQHRSASACCLKACVGTLAIATATWLVVATPLSADDVHMKNGQSFKDIIAFEEGDGVRIQLAFGEITVPRSSVARIVRGSSTVDEYLTRGSELQRRGAGADEWLALARGAASEGVDHGAREAGLKAAKLDPALEGLAPLLRSLGYSFSEQRQEWLSSDDYLRSLGYVRTGGEWVSPEEIAERQRIERVATEERRAARAAARDERLAQAVELLTVKALAEEAAPPEPRVGLPIAIFPGYYPPPVYTKSAPPYRAPYYRGPTAEDPPYALDILERMPGSLFPIRSRPPGKATPRHVSATPGKKPSNSGTVRRH